MDPQPLVSICIPTYNGSQFLEGALDSIIQQSYKHIELVVSDDGSKDGTIEIVKEFMKKVDFPVHLFAHNPSGIGANWNNCIYKSSGKYIKFLFQDDILFPTCIMKMVLVLESNEKVKFVSSKRNIIVEDPDHKGVKSWMKIYSDLQANLSIPVKDDIMILGRSLFGSPTFLKSPLNKVGEPSCTMFSKDLVNKVGYFREDLYQILDYDFFFRVLKETNIAIINEKLVSFRLHSQQETRRNVNKSREDIEAFDLILLRNYFFYLSWKQQKELLRRISRNFLRNRI